MFATNCWRWPKPGPPIDHPPQASEAVTGGDDSDYEQGLWALAVDAPDVYTAERLASEEMHAD